MPPMPTHPHPKKCHTVNFLWPAQNIYLKLKLFISLFANGNNSLVQFFFHARSIKICLKKVIVFQVRFNERFRNRSVTVNLSIKGKRL